MQEGLLRDFLRQAELPKRANNLEEAEISQSSCQRLSPTDLQEKDTLQQVELCNKLVPHFTELPADCTVCSMFPAFVSCHSGLGELW